MSTPRARGLSLWLMPEAQINQRLTELIARLAARHQTELFAPHLTLLSAVALPEALALAAAGRAAAEIAPLVVTPAGIQAREEHFRCLFVCAREDAALSSAHAAAARAFGRPPDPDFLPHLSLVYGMLPAEEKQALAREVGEAPCAPFEARRLHLWRTEGPVVAWRELGAFDLRPAPSP
jgi:2'-5' RNA ligase